MATRRRRPRRRVPRSQDDDQDQAGSIQRDTTVPVVPQRPQASGPMPRAPASGPTPAPVDQIWFVMLDGDQVGPMAPARVKELVNAGRITHDTPIRKASMTAFVPAGQVKGLLPPRPPEPETEVVLPSVVEDLDEDADVWDASDTQAL